MALYVDCHEANLDLTKDRLESGQRDEYGALGLRTLVAKNKHCCFTEAPNADAILKGHEKDGVGLEKGEVREITWYESAFQHC